MSKGNTFIRPCRSRRRFAGGQSVVEFAIVLPLMLFFLTGAYTVWQAVHEDIALTNAARAAAIMSVRSLNTAISTSGGHGPGVPSKAQECAALHAAQTGIAQEENIPTASVTIDDPPPIPLCPGVHSCATAGNNICVRLTYASRPLASFGENYYVAQVTLTQQLKAGVPLMPGVHITSSATDSTV